MPNRQADTHMISMADRSDPKFHAYQQKRLNHWDTLAGLLSRWTGWGGSYHNRLRRIYGNIIPPGRRILEIGCGEGDLLGRGPLLVGKHQNDVLVKGRLDLGEDRIVERLR